MGSGGAKAHRRSLLFPTQARPGAKAGRDLPVLCAAYARHPRFDDPHGFANHWWTDAPSSRAWKSLPARHGISQAGPDHVHLYRAEITLYCSLPRSPLGGQHPWKGLASRIEAKLKPAAMSQAAPNDAA
jgi:hypothetical protein